MNQRGVMLRDLQSKRCDLVAANFLQIFHVLARLLSQDRRFSTSVIVRL